MLIDGLDTAIAAFALRYTGNLPSLADASPTEKRDAIDFNLESDSVRRRHFTRVFSQPKSRHVAAGNARNDLLA